MRMLFYDEFQKLNYEQAQVVNELSENILLLASAGTGKTKSIALRIANIIKKEKATAKEILCLTFTNRACKEMREKIAPIVGNDTNQLTIKTFHSFCYSIMLSESKKNTDLHYDSIIFDEEDCKELLKELIKNVSNTKALQAFIDFVKELKIITNYSDYKKIVKYAFEHHHNRIEKICVNVDYQVDKKLIELLFQYGHTLIERYNAYLAERHGVDFNDLLINVHEVFKNETVLKFWQNKYKFLHIDEAQDTNAVEYSIISKLFPDNVIMLCADYFQTIYEWRGSSPKSTLRLFKTECNPVEIFFNKNYRATRALLHASTEYLINAFDETSKSTYSIDIQPMSLSSGKEIEVYAADNSKDEATWIYNKIKQLNLKDITKVAILTRSNRINTELSNMFTKLNAMFEESQQIPFILVDEFKFFRRREVKDILAFLKVIVNKYDETSFKRILQTFAKDIGEKTISEICGKENRLLGIRLTDFLIDSTYDFFDPYELLIRELAKNNVIIFDVESTGIDVATDEIIQIAAVRINHKGETLESFEKFLKPSISVRDSERVHGFSDNFLSAHGRDPKTVLLEFKDFIKNSLVVGHNVTYDLSILKSQLQRMKLEEVEIIDYYDTLDLARRFYPKLENHKLETICKYFNTKTSSDHNAINDVLATGEILINITNEKILPFSSKRVEIYEKFVPKFTKIYDDLIALKRKSASMRPVDLINEIIKVSDICTFYANRENGGQRIRNINEFINIAREMDFPEENNNASLIELLKITSLSNSELDRIIEKRPSIPIITVHQSKGSEYDYIFIAGLQDFTFPSYQAIKEGNIDEEKRVFYVAITRAKKELYLSWSEYDSRGKKGISRFIKWLPHNS